MSLKAPTAAEVALKLAQSKKEKPALSYHSSARLVASWWKKMLVYKYDGVNPPLFTQKQIGQLRDIIVNSSGRSNQVFEAALDDWGGFTLKAQEQKGLKVDTLPRVPQVWFLLAHLDVALAHAKAAQERKSKEMSGQITQRSAVAVPEALEQPQGHVEKESMPTVSIWDTLSDLGIEP